MPSRKQEKIRLSDVFSEFKELKNIDKEAFSRVLEDAFRSVIAKNYGSDENFDIIINPTKGDLEIYRTRTVVDDNEAIDDVRQVGLSEAQELDPDAQVGEEVVDKVDFASFGRRMILNLRQTLMSRIIELQKESTYNKYVDLKGQIASGELYQIWKKEMLLLDEKGEELYIPKPNQIPGDFFKKGEIIRGVVMQVENKNQKLHITLSRTSPLFLQRLFEQEIPEIHDGLISIRNIARIPGERAKVAVESFDNRVDPVGACVGANGTRIHAVVRELRNENIDVIHYSEDMAVYIQRALAPAKIPISSIHLNEAEKTAEIYIKPAEISLAIGRGGYNIKLASMITGYHLDIFRELENEDVEDIELDEFNDEIDQWVIDVLKGIGMDTAKDVLNVPKGELLNRTDLEEETIDEVIRILQAEFEND